MSGRRSRRLATLHATPVLVRSNRIGRAGRDSPDPPKATKHDKVFRMIPARYPLVTPPSLISLRGPRPEEPLAAVPLTEQVYT